MAVVMRNTDFRAIVEPIINEEFDGVYDQRKDEWSMVFSERKGIARAYHEEPMLYGFGSAPEMPDGQGVVYGSGGVLYQARYIYKVYGLAFAITRVLKEDGEHITIGSIYARHLAQSLIETKELLAANILNRAFNASFIGGDGVSLVSASHPLATGGTWSNLLTTAANLSQTSLEQQLIQVRNAIDHTGKRIRLTAQKLVVASNNEFQAEVILNSALRTGTANNDLNPIKSMSMLPKGQACMSRLTNPNAWWVQTDAPEGLKLLMRRKMEKSMEGDFETDSMRFKATERYAFGWTDPRTLWGTPGI